MDFKMTGLLKYYFICSIGIGANILAEDMPKGNETGNREISIAAATVLKNVNEGKTYKIDKKVEGCPEYVQLKKTKEQTSDKELSFYMDGYDKSDGVFNLQNSSFWRERSYFDYDLSKNEGKKVGKKDNGCGFVLGIGCSSQYQTTNKDSVVFESNSKVISLVMVAFVKSSVKFDTVKDKISYQVDETLCTYSAAPEVDKEIKAYHAAVDKKRNDYINDTKREKGKNIAPEIESSGAASRGTSSK